MAPDLHRSLDLFFVNIDSKVHLLLFRSAAVRSATRVPKEINDKHELSRRWPIPVPESGQRLGRQSGRRVFQTNDF
jgi:hypothetical protein